MSSDGSDFECDSVSEMATNIARDHIEEEAEDTEGRDHMEDETDEKEGNDIAEEDYLMGEVTDDEVAKVLVHFNKNARHQRQNRR